MQKLQGIAVSPGVAIGEALVVDNEGFRIPQRFVARDAVDDALDLYLARHGVGLSKLNPLWLLVAGGVAVGAVALSHYRLLHPPRAKEPKESKEGT